MIADEPRDILRITVAPTDDGGHVGIAMHVADSGDLTLALLAILRAVASGDSGLPLQVQKAAIVMLETILPGENVMAVPVLIPPGGPAS